MGFAKLAAASLAMVACAPSGVARTTAGNGSRGADALAETDASGISAPADAGIEATVVTAQYDPGQQFSFAHNPVGPWRYGYTQTATLALDQVLLDAYGISSDGGLEIWHPNDAGGAFSPLSNPSDGGGGYYPYVAANVGATTYVYAASWALRPGEIGMEASNAGQLSVVQFIAPTASSCDVQAHFEGVHFRLSTTDVHVRVGDTELFSAMIDGYGGDPSAFAVQGASPTADYRGTVSLAAGDIVTFAVGRGADGTNYNDTTGLLAHLVCTAIGSAGSGDP